MISRVMVKSTKRIGSIVLILNTIYLTWLGFNIVNTVGWLLLIAEILIFSLTLFYIVNHWKQLHVYNHHIVATDKSLDIFITVVNETSAMFEKTLISLTKIDYENKQIYVLDDGPREEIKKLADKHGVTYLARKDKSHSKAGNLNFGVNNSKGEYILVIDADQIVTNPSIAKNLLHYFAEDPKVAMVITRQKFDVPKGDFNHDNLFYDHMQPGKNDNNSAISCGSGVFYRRSALEDIGGFQTWNIVEDLYTSYVFHKSGYRSIYINKSYTLGTAPQDLSTIYKQRGTWALDTLRIFFKKSPIFTKGLTLRQKLHYTEIAWAYIVSAVAIPILFILPSIALLFNLHVVANESVYLFFRIPSLAAILYFYYVLSGKSFSAGQFWASLSFVYLKALILSLLPFKIKYKVTNKFAGPKKRDIALILPHMALILFAAIAVMWRIFYADRAITSFTGINILWMTLMIFWFTPIIRKGFLIE